MADIGIVEAIRKFKQETGSEVSVTRLSVDDTWVVIEIDGCYIYTPVDTNGKDLLRLMRKVFYADI